jgi:hypothetical protein
MIDHTNHFSPEPANVDRPKTRIAHAMRFPHLESQRLNSKISLAVSLRMISTTCLPNTFPFLRPQPQARVNERAQSLVPSPESLSGDSRNARLCETLTLVIYNIITPVSRSQIAEFPTNDRSMASDCDRLCNPRVRWSEAWTSAKRTQTI